MDRKPQHLPTLKPDCDYKITIFSRGLSLSISIYISTCRCLTLFSLSLSVFCLLCLYIYMYIYIIYRCICICLSLSLFVSLFLWGLPKGWVSKRVVLADVPPERKPERGYIQKFPRNENPERGYVACSPGTKTGTGVRSPKHPFMKPPFYLPVTVQLSINLFGDVSGHFSYRVSIGIQNIFGAVSFCRGCARKDPHLHTFGLNKKMTRFTKGRFCPY